MDQMRGPVAAAGVDRLFARIADRYFYTRRYQNPSLLLHSTLLLEESELVSQGVNITVARQSYGHGRCNSEVKDALDTPVGSAGRQEGEGAEAGEPCGLVMW